MSISARMFVLALVVVALLCGCNDPWDDPPEAYCPDLTPWIEPPALAGVPDTLAVCGGRYVLACDLWRDFQPVCPPDGEPMIAVASLMECDSLAVPDGLVFDHLWVIDGADFWSTGLDGAMRHPVEPYRIQARAGCGPKWDPGLLVDVIVSVRCGEESPRCVRAFAVPIHRTE